MGESKFIKSSMIVMLLIIAGKFLAIFRDALVAAKFGATYAGDIYNFSIGIIYLITTVSYGLTTTFIPIHARHIEEESKKKRNFFVNNILNTYSIFTIVLIVFLIIFAKYIILIFGHGFINNPQIYNTSIKVIRIMLLSLLFVSIQSVITGVLQAHKHFYEPAAMAIVSNIVFIIYLVFFTKTYGIYGFAVATVIGFLAQLLINIPKYKKLGYSYQPSFNFKDKELKSMLMLMMPVIVSTSVVQLNNFVNRSFATNIFEGAVTALDFSNKINTMAYEVFAIGISMIIYPTLSSLAAKGDKIQYKKALIKGINIILIIMVPATVAIAILRIPLINIIFKRGLFDDSAVNITAGALLFYCPAMIAYGVRDILNKAFYSIKDTKTPMINSFIGIIINIIINIFIIKYMKVSGLALATSIASIITTLFMIIDLNKKLKGINVKLIFHTFIKIVMASMVMGVVVFFINKYCFYIIGNNIKGSIFSIIISFIIGSISYFIIIYMLKVDEFMYLFKSLKTRFKI